MSGFNFTPAESSGHIATPQTGTYARENGGGPASLLLGADYPVIAACKICGGRIRLDHKMQMEWRHAPAAVAAPAPPAGDAA
jgi:hypothetical protein